MEIVLDARWAGNNDAVEASRFIQLAARNRLTKSWGDTPPFGYRELKCYLTTTIINGHARPTLLSLRNNSPACDLSRVDGNYPEFFSVASSVEGVGVDTPAKSLSPRYKSCSDNLLYVRPDENTQ